MNGQKDDPEYRELQTKFTLEELDEACLTIKPSTSLPRAKSGSEVRINKRAAQVGKLRMWLITKEV
jgi:hypothetical protein